MGTEMSRDIFGTEGSVEVTWEEPKETFRGDCGFRANPGPLASFVL